MPPATKPGMQRRPPVSPRHPRASPGGLPDIGTPGRRNRRHRIQWLGPGIGHIPGTTHSFPHTCWLTLFLSSWLNLSVLVPVHNASTNRSRRVKRYFNPKLITDMGGNNHRAGREYSSLCPVWLVSLRPGNGCSHAGFFHLAG